ncbi:MAG: phospholipid carrier-dependent glycosyltransferase, partial [Moheibacter sp.]
MFDLKKPYNLLLIGSIFFLIGLYFLTWNVPFFWDATSKSSRATWLFDHNFSQWVVPTEISSGHPPLWELLLATTWKFTDRTIEYSRLLLLLFNIGVYWQLILFIKENKLKNVPIFVTILVLVEPTLLAQSTIINNDMMLVFFTFLGLNSIYKNQKLLYSIALTGVLFS